MITVTVNDVLLQINSFALRLDRPDISPAINYSELLNINYLGERNIAVDDIIKLYHNDNLVFTGLVNLKQYQAFRAIGEAVLGVETVTARGVIYYSNDRIRVPLDFSIVPGCLLSTELFNIRVGEVTHYQLYSDIGF